MKTILEISTKNETHYEMPDEIYELIEIALTLRAARTVKAALAGLPITLREQVKVHVAAKPLNSGPIIGCRANVLMIDDCAFKQEYLNEFWNELPKDKVPPIFPDRSR